MPAVTRHRARAADVTGGCANHCTIWVSVRAITYRVDDTRSVGVGGAQKLTAPEVVPLEISKGLLKFPSGRGSWAFGTLKITGRS